MYYSGDQIKKNEMGVACEAYGGEERCIYGFGGGDLRVRGYLEDLGIDGRIILKWMLRKWDGEAYTGLIWLRIGTGGGRV